MYVDKTTLLNITHYGVETCEAIKFALSNKGRLHELGIATSDLSIINAALQLTQEKPIGEDFHKKMSENAMEWLPKGIYRGAHKIPSPRAELRQLFKLSGVPVPMVLPKVRGGAGRNVDTERKLPSRRKP